MLQSVTQDLWIVDAGHVDAGGLRLPLRMTVIRLANGDVLLHSPTAYSPGLHADIARIGPIRHLVAPSIGHWMFLRDWQRACDDAKTWGVPGLRDRRPVRRAGVSIDLDLGDHAPSAWAGQIDQVLVAGPIFKEVAFFHRASRTLILTDLILNLDGQHQTRWGRLMAAALGILAPKGKAPLYTRVLLSLNRTSVARALSRIIAFQPERVIFAHGRLQGRSAGAALHDAFAWAGPAQELDGAAGSPRWRSVLLVGLSTLAIVGLLGRRRRNRHAHR